ncbi:MAG: hypothetical protein LQ337_001666 [Flavoplaca oasis]|nr:MAG: hypothetical protein LQ337_001666 [Flavoplaca oasis]
MSSIENDHERETAEVSAEQAVIDGSVGSDTDTSKPLTSDTAGKDPSDILHHARSNSVNVKKPATFKAVSVTKNFLAKAGTTAPAGKTSGDNTAETSTTPVNNAPSAPRPRLVAKTASGHQAKTSRTPGSTFRNGGASGPDASQVWNRNRAAPPTAPKIFTDEELKQQYGISLATRLQADGDGKEAKWADIDDDEDDWAPDTIEWNDGTKISLADSNAAAAFAEEQAAAQALKEKQEAEAKAKAAQAKPATTVGPNATVLKIGQAGQPKGGLVLKSPMEKPTLVAKPAAPAPVKSPWASIPAVDKVPPVPIVPPSQGSQPRPQQTEQQKSESMPPPATVAMEIAADSFTRNRRDSPNAPPGQLFNSQSGQYEPASAGRRGSIRKEQNFRPPAVLQRPSPSDQRKSAEPSTTLQSNRAGGPQEAGLWTRRGSSAVSGENGLLPQKASMNRGIDVSRATDEVLQQRRDSQPLRSPASLDQQLTDASPAGASPQLQKAGPMGPHIASRGNDSIDAEREAQKKIMREKRELAIKRKAEEEAKEEAAKKERIRQKMEKLGMEPLPSDDKLANKPALPTVLGFKGQPKSEKRDDELNSSLQPKSIPAPAAAATETGQPLPAVHSPPKPPMPDASGEPKQYGMMKVHGQILTNGVTNHEAALNEGSMRQAAHNNDAALDSRQQVPGLSPTPSHTTKESSEPRMVNGDTPVNLPDPRFLPNLDQHASQHNHKLPSRQQTWSTHPNDVKGWASGVMPTHSAPGSNLWGPPSNHKALGNGTFDQGVPRPQSRQAPYEEHFKAPVPQPIARPLSIQRPRQSPEAARASEATSVPLIEDMQTVPSFPSADSSAKPAVSAPSSVLQAQAPQPQLMQATNQPRIPAPSPAAAGPSQRGEIGERERGVAAWGNFYETSARDAEVRRQEQAQKAAARSEEEARTGIRHKPQLPSMQEIWRQTSDQSGQRETISVTKRQTHQQAQPIQQGNRDVRIPPFAAESGQMLQINSGRNSRFFPANGQGFNSRAVTIPVGFFRQPSPPPPDTSSHPAYAREGRPLVNLPTSKPRPTVRLPPSTVTPSQSPVPSHATIIPLRAMSQPLINNPSWQDRFNGLLGVSKRPSPEMKRAQLVDFSPSTKIPLDVPTTVTSASVSLPPAIEDIAVLKEVGKVTSKDVEDEEELFEDRGFGSVPQVSLPAKAPEGVGFVTATKPKRQVRTLKTVDPESKRVFEPDTRENQTPEGLMISISLPNSEKRTKTLVRGKGQGGSQTGTQQPGSQRPQRHMSNHSKATRGGPKSKDGSNHYHNAGKYSQGGPQRNASQGSSGPPMRGQREGFQREPKPSWFYGSSNMNSKTGVLV